MLDHTTSEIALGRRSKLGLDATKKLPGEGFKHAWPLLIKMEATVKPGLKKLFRRKDSCGTWLVEARQNE